MSVTVIDACRDERWRSAADHRYGSLFSSPPWIEAVARAYGLAMSASVRVRSGAVAAGIPFAHVRDIRGDRIVSLPFSDYCDPLVDDDEAWRDLVGPLLAYDSPVTLRCLRNTVPVEDTRFQTSLRGLWHGVDLTRTEDDLWSDLDGSARQNVRKARRSGVTIREGRTLNDVRIFHDMHCRLRKTKHRLLAQPLAFFETLHELFSPTDGLTVLLAECGGQVVAGILFLEWGGTLYYKFNASVDQRHCPNDLLAWEGIRMGRRRGLTRFDFGLSDVEQPGLVRYKRKFATEESCIRLLQWRPQGYSDPRAEQASQMLGRVTSLFTDPAVPDDIARAAGNELYRYFC
jgi:CelD/BcsL family acetyltransferase involved in cellulose biosynthesis